MDRKSSVLFLAVTQSSVYSTEAGKGVVEKQQTLNLPEHKLKQDISMSTYEMVERIIEQQQAVCAVFAEDGKLWSNR